MYQVSRTKKVGTETDETRCTDVACFDTSVAKRRAALAQTTVFKRTVTTIKNKLSVQFWSVEKLQRAGGWDAIIKRQIAQLRIPPPALEYVRYWSAEHWSRDFFDVLVLSIPHIRTSVQFNNYMWSGLPD